MVLKCKVSPNGWILQMVGTPGLLVGFQVLRPIVPTNHISAIPYDFLFDGWVYDEAVVDLGSIAGREVCNYVPDPGEGVIQEAIYAETYDALLMLYGNFLRLHYSQESGRVSDDEIEALVEECLGDFEAAISQRLAVRWS